MKVVQDPFAPFESGEYTMVSVSSRYALAPIHRKDECRGVLKG